MISTNDLLGTDGIDGIKTGTLKGSDLLFSSTVTVGLPKPLTITSAGSTTQPGHEAAYTNKSCSAAHPELKSR